MEKREIVRLLDMLWVLRGFVDGEVSIDAAARVAAELLGSGFVKPGEFRDALVVILAAYGAERLGRAGLALSLASNAKDMLRSALVVGANYAIIDNRDAGVAMSVKDAAWHGLKVIVYGEKAYIAGDDVEVVIDDEVRATPWCIEEPEIPRECIVYVVRGRMGDRRVEGSFDRLDKAIDWVLVEAIRYRLVHA